MTPVKISIPPNIMVALTATFICSAIKRRKTKDQINGINVTAKVQETLKILEEYLF